jgi:hypothetical protein
MVHKVVLGQVFSEYFSVPCQFSFHRLLHTHHHHLSSGAGTIGQLVADVPSGLSLTPPQFTALYVIRRFIPMLTRTRHQSVSCSIWVQYTPSQHIYLRFILILFWVSQMIFLPKCLHACSCLTNLVNLDLITVFFFLPRCSHTWERAPASEHRAEITVLICQIWISHNVLSSGIWRREVW